MVSFAGVREAGTEVRGVLSETKTGGRVDGGEKSRSGGSFEGGGGGCGRGWGDSGREGKLMMLDYCIT